MSNRCDLQPLLSSLRDQTRSDTILVLFGKLSCIVSILNVIINSIISAFCKRNCYRIWHLGQCRLSLDLPQVH